MENAELAEGPHSVRHAHTYVRALTAELTGQCEQVFEARAEGLVLTGLVGVDLWRGRPAHTLLDACTHTLNS